MIGLFEYLHLLCSLSAMGSRTSRQSKLQTVPVLTVSPPGYTVTNDTKHLEPELNPADEDLDNTAADRKKVETLQTELQLATERLDLANERVALGEERNIFLSKKVSDLTDKCQNLSDKLDTNSKVLTHLYLGTYPGGVTSRLYYTGKYG